MHVRGDDPERKRGLTARPRAAVNAPHSKTLARMALAPHARQRFGVRQPPGAFGRTGRGRVNGSLRADESGGCPHPSPRILQTLLFHAQNTGRLFRAAKIEQRPVASFFAQELSAQGRLRGDDQDFLFVVQHLGAAGARAEEVK